jgi:ribosomal-protein-alanine N-acetyltransferase
VGTAAHRNFRIRQPRLSDLDKLLAIENRSFRSHRFTARDFQYHYENSSSIFAVVEVADELVGYIAGIVYHGARLRTAKIYSMAVMPGLRHKGIGSSLLKHFETRARANKCHSITLEVRKTNRPARALYERFGYTVEEVLPDYYAPGSDGLRMRKLLEKGAHTHDLTKDARELRGPH